MTIEDNPQILTDYPENIKLKKSDIEKIKQWVIKHKEILLKLSYREIHIGNFCNYLKNVNI